ncbi:MAG: hypothetical protein HGA75_16915 [Thiobacillus sp.]|nr:hypothetical protein [Thiobacillus sp.]
MPALLAVLLAGCAGTPAPGNVPAPDKGRQAEAGRKQYNKVFEGRYVLDYEVETRYSSIDKTSCYAFLTGTLNNRTAETLSRRTTVAFKVYHGDELLFRDYTYLRSNVAPGSRVQFDMVESPLHLKQCPTYDRIEADLNLVILKNPAP